MEVVSTLSRNTILVIQQLFSNMSTAACILLFKGMGDMSTPDFMYSFYFLISVNACCTIHFATFHCKYLSRNEEKVNKKKNRTGVFQPLRPPATARYPKPRRTKDDSPIQDWRKTYPFLVPQRLSFGCGTKTTRKTVINNASSVILLYKNSYVETIPAIKITNIPHTK